MKFSAAMLGSLVASQANAFFVPSSSSHQSKTTALNVEKENKNDGVVAVAASTILVGLGISAQAAFADDTYIQQLQPQHYSPTISSSTVIAEVDQFSLPSYDSSKGSTLIDISSDLEKVNKKTLQQAKAKREYKDNSAEKLEADELRKLEKEGASSLLDSLVSQSDLDRKAQIEAEKAESRANRWKTF